MHCVSRWLCIIGTAWAVLSLGSGRVSAQSAAPEVKFGDVTDKFVRNMKLLRSMVEHPELGQMMDVVVKKAEDLQSVNNSKNADEKRFRIMKQMEAMTRREGIKESDQRKLEELQRELRELDPDGSFQRARGEINRSITELQNILGQVTSPDPKTEDVLRLIRMHVALYQKCLGKMN